MLESTDKRRGPDAEGRQRVLSAVAARGPISRRTLELVCDRHFRMPADDLARYLADLAECGLVEPVDENRLTGEPLYAMVAREDVKRETNRSTTEDSEGRRGKMRKPSTKAPRLRGQR